MVDTRMSKLWTRKFGIHRIYISVTCSFACYRSMNSIRITRLTPESSMIFSYHGYTNTKNITSAALFTQEVTNGASQLERFTLLNG